MLRAGFDEAGEAACFKLRHIRACRQNADLAGELIAVRPETMRISTRCAPKAARKAAIWAALDVPARPRADHQRLLADDGTASFEQRHQHVEGAPAKLDRPAISEHVAAIWQHRKATERDTRQSFAVGIHSRELQRVFHEISYFLTTNRQAA
jgi:hypothetical protein